ncbi:glycosyl hydrolase family 3 N terminal domain-containing protein [Rutstroemia sp. NJR-2017a BBW]|nr:glycosyl hydrolase family 3 N terminal domain-containing protein [Rutstroemia sp. NJR-2017a BBW]
MTNRIDVEDVLSKLNNVEKVSLLAGLFPILLIGFEILTSIGADWWHTTAIPNHKIPSIRVSDGPNGVRGTKFFNGTTAACFPNGTALGATWDKDLLHRAGVLMGEEAKAKGTHVILGPTINMQRSPLGGRGFESFSEDPYLAGLGAAALVNGIQETGVVATIKHFVCNDQEHERNAVNVIITERALRELYLLPFQLVVKESRPGCFMTAYNKINGLHVSENKRIIGDILRGEWGWEGCIMSDWWGTYSTSGAANAGLDLEMPGSTKWRGEMLIQAVGVGKVPQHTLDERARNVLKLVNRCADAKIPEHAEEKTANTPETAALLREIGADSIVLLKNENNVLPLKKDKKTLIVGPNAKTATYHGGGSASLAAYYAVTPFDGISAQLESDPLYTVGCYAHKELPLIGLLLKTSTGETGISFKAYNDPPDAESRELADEIILTKTELLMMDYNCPRLKNALWWADIEGYMTAEEDCDFELGLGVYGTANLYVDGKLVIDNSTKQTRGTMFFSCGTVEEKGVISLKKGQTYHLKIEFGSSPTCKLDQGSNVLSGGGAVRLGGAKVIDADEEIARAAELAKQADQVIICAGLNADWEGEGTDREIFGLPHHMNKLISTLTQTNPNTAVVIQSGTPVALPFLDSTPALLQAWYGGNETGNAIADIIFGNINPSAKLPLSFPKRIEDNPAFLSFRSERGRVIYGEDVYMGYRWYEALNLPVNFPFGHGLSYTTFKLSNLSVERSSDGSELSVSIKVKNLGEIAGKEVVQVYIRQENPSIRRPKKELKGFAKVSLDKGEEKQVEVKLDVKYAAAFWDEVREAWIVEKDTYEVIVGSTSEEGAGELKGTFNVERTTWWNGL